MTVTQIVITVVGLIFGYCVVNYMLSKGGVEDKKSRSSPCDHESRSDESSSSTDQRGRAYNSTAGGTRSPFADGAEPAWYQVLGITESASLDEIDQAYRTQISQYHPDKVTKLGEDIRRLAEARSKQINSAHDIASRLRRK